jgi:glycosyltransferase involved in cell wall biosynthesis
MTNKDSLVSVVIPTFNRSQMIERAIHSVLSQTYLNLEVIVVDDSSTDDSREHIEALQQIDKRIHYFHHEINRGTQAARNTGIKAANGKYIAFLDSDNEWLPHKLELQMPLFCQRANKLGVAYCGIQNETCDNKFFREHVPKNRGYVYPIVLRQWIADTSTLVVRKEYLDKVGGFDESIRAYQEWDLCIRLAHETEFDYVEEILAIYHLHEGITISKNMTQNALGYLDVINVHYYEILHEVGRKILSDHFYKAGRIFMQAGVVRKARSCFIKSIKLFPANMRTWEHLIVSSLGCDRYQKALSFMRKQMILRGHNNNVID